MPKYLYHCEECEEDFYVTHLMSEACEECLLCGESDCVGKKISSFRTFTKKNDLKSGHSGDIVKRSIEEIRKEVNSERDRLKKVTF